MYFHSFLWYRHVANRFPGMKGSCKYAVLVGPLECSRLHAFAKYNRTQLVPINRMHTPHRAKYTS